MRFLLLVCLSCIALAFTGCPESSGPMEPDDGSENYSLDYTQIENLLADLEQAWIRREIDRYADLLSEDFVFVFQEDDADGIPNGYWNKSEDVLGVGRIFNSSQVTAIRSDLTWGQPQDGETTKINEELATRLIVFDTFLDVDLDGGETTLRIDGDVQWFYCQMGDENQGEDPSRWYIVEWQDLGSTTLAAVEPSSWGRLKQGIQGDNMLLTEGATFSGIKALLGNKPSGSMSEDKTWGSIKSLYGSKPRPAVENTTWGGIKRGPNKPRSAVESTTVGSIKKRF